MMASQKASPKQVSPAQPVAQETHLPFQPHTVEETGLNFLFLVELLAKILFLRGQLHLADLAEHAKLSVSVRHRLGRLNVGDASVIIATGCPHRDAAYRANRYVIEELKKRVPIWKKEHLDDSSYIWTENKS